ncbi:hypothetical protein PIB30_086651 [Stylosanthes scabra]|uniref:Uncharacterized protein n=1 Tax=Stylosanthes scabra TaxID=79078 RepID=A0ABU6XVJ6_9FABA|nr:hypothetical protein [Stylosanthes scabra]
MVKASSIYRHKSGHWCVCIALLGAYAYGPVPARTSCPSHGNANSEPVARAAATRLLQGNQNNIRFDPKPERSLFRRRREARMAIQELLEQKLDMAANNNNNEIPIPEEQIKGLHLDNTLILLRKNVATSS